MARVVAGTVVMLAALGLQLAMVIRAIEPSAALALAGYAGLFAGMLLVLLGLLGRRPPRA